MYKRPQLLNAISPDNIQAFGFSFTSTGDSEDAVADQIVSRISHFKNLQTLKLTRCDVSDVGALGIHDLPQLKVLDMSYSLITAKSLPLIGKLSSIEELVLNSVDLSHSDLSSLGRLPKLVNLFVRSSQLTDAMVGALKPASKLEMLDLSNNRGITDACLTYLAAMPNLKIVCLSSTSVNVRSLNKLSRLGKIVVATRDLQGRRMAYWRKIIPNLELDVESQMANARTKPGAEEMHLFAPTRF